MLDLKIQLKIITVKKSIDIQLKIITVKMYIPD